MPNKELSYVNYNGDTYEINAVKVNNHTVQSDVPASYDWDKSKVEISELTSSGNKIGKITIDGDGQTLYSPAYTATSPISVNASTLKISHASSGVSADTYGVTATTDVEPAFGGSFNVPGFTVNATGHITAAGSHKVYIPALSVSQNLTSGTKVGTITINGNGVDLYAPTNTNTTYTLSKTDDDLKLTPSSGQAQTVTLNTVDGTHNGLMSTALYSKLNGISENANKVEISTILNSGTQIATVTVDGVTSATLYAPTQTHYTAKLFAGAANGTANATTTDGNTYLILTDNGTNTSQVKLKSGGNTTITSDNAGVITIKSEDSFDGTVTQVTAGAGLNTTSNDTATDGGSITTSGTLYLTKSGVTAGTYQGITVDKYGRVTAASNQGYVKSSGVTSVQVKATSPVASSQSAAQTSTLTTTISLEDGYGDTQNPYDTKNPHYVLAGPSTGSGAAAAQKPTFRALVGDDLPLATNSAQGVIKPWYHHTAASTGPTTGSNATAVTVNTISTTAGKYYAIESDSNGRLFVNVPWTNTDNDTKVSQTDVVTPANWRKVLMGSQNSATKNVAVSDTTSGAFATNSFEYQPSTGTLRSKKYMVNDAVTLEYNATTKSLDFIFA